MPDETDDILTEQQAHIIAHDYGFCPYEPLKCERTINTTDLRTLFFANTTNIVKVLLGYNRNEVGKKLIEGAPCTACWSAGKTWEDEMVPKYVFCSLSGFYEPVEFLNTVFDPGEPVKMGVYLLEQQNAPDCTYEYLDDDVEIIWTPGDVESTLLVTTKPDDIVRMNADAGGCFRQFKQNGTLAEINCC